MNTLRQKIRYTAKLYGLNYLLLMIAMTLIHYTIGAGSFPPSPLATSLNDSVVSILLGSCVVAPISEELVFRLPLKGGRMILLCYFVLLVMLLVAGPSDFSIVSWPVLLLGAGVYCGAYAYRRCWTDYADRLSRSIRRHRTAAVTLSSLLFAYVHYLSVDFLGDPSLLLLLLPQFITGMTLCLVRIRCGIGYSIGYHAVHNAMIMVPSLLILKS